jgi:pimeloyl-ACP methyl ester carboxylesterase
MKWLARAFAAIVGVALLAVATGALWQRWATARDVARFPMPGERIDIGGRALHLHCAGAGDVTVVLENGLTGNYTAWMRVFPALAELTRVCNYDRAGMGFSDPSEEPTRAEFVAEDLARLLAASSTPPPYLLVGWSAGGVFIRRFHAIHPHHVAGMVFVDSSHEQQRLRLPALPGVDDDAVLTPLRWCDRLAWTGIVRFSGVMGEMNARFELPQPMRDEVLAMAHRSDYCAGMLHEIADFPADLVAEHGPTSLGDLPLVVLSRGRASSAADFVGTSVDPAALAAVDRVWDALQAELAALSTRALHRRLADSGHAIPLEAPDAVVDAVVDVLQMAVSTRARAPALDTTQHPASSE